MVLPLVPRTPVTPTTRHPTRRQRYQEQEQPEHGSPAAQPSGSVHQQKACERCHPGGVPGDAIGWRWFGIRTGRRGEYGKRRAAAGRSCKIDRVGCSKAESRQMLRTGRGRCNGGAQGYVAAKPARRHERDQRGIVRGRTWRKFERYRGHVEAGQGHRDHRDNLIPRSAAEDARTCAVGGVCGRDDVVAQSECGRGNGDGCAGACGEWDWVRLIAAAGQGDGPGRDCRERRQAHRLEPSPSKRLCDCVRGIRVDATTIGV